MLEQALTVKRCQRQQDWQGQYPYLGGFVENTGRFESPDKTVPEPSTHSLVLPSECWNTALVPVTFFQSVGDNKTKLTFPTDWTQLCMCCCSSLAEHFHQKVLHPETSHHISYSLHCGLSLTLVVKQHGYTATHSPFSSESWEVKIPCNVLKLIGTWIGAKW